MYWRPVCSYVSPAGRDKIRDWYEGLSIEEQADADELIKNQRRIETWQMPQYKHLFDGIGELRWKSAKKAQRLLGYFEGDTWVALIGCYHKGRAYTPRDTLAQAKKRKAELERGEASKVEYDL